MFCREREKGHMKVERREKGEFGRWG